MAEDTRDRLIRYLDDAWAVEKGLVDTLNEMADEVNDANVRSVFQEHARVTKQQEEDLEARIRALGEEPSGGKGLLNSVMGGLADMLQGAHDEFDKTTQDLMKAYATENFEMAMYESLRAYCSAIGDTETAALASRLFEQEHQAASLVWPLITACAPRAATAAYPQQRAA